jgi:hypothetical protein
MLTCNRTLEPAQEPLRDRGRSQKTIVLENLDAAIEQAGGGYRFGERQLLYVLRPIVMAETVALQGRLLGTGYR